MWNKQGKTYPQKMSYVDKLVKTCGYHLSNVEEIVVNLSVLHIKKA